MIRSIATVHKSRPSNSVALRLFANGSVVDVSDDIASNSDSKDSLLHAILNNAKRSDSMAYSLAMASLEGPNLPPLLSYLKDRERAQIQISRAQQRHFRGNGRQEKGNKITEQQRVQDHQKLLRTIHEDSNVHNCLAYSLAMSDQEDESGFPSLTRSLNEREIEQLRISQSQFQNDRMLANKQLNGRNVPREKEPLPTTYDNKEDGVDDCCFDALALSYSLSFAASLNDGSVQFPSLTRPFNDREINQLRISKSQLSTSTYPEQRRQHHPLPRTLQDALRRKSEAIVITETKKPFRVFNVNSAWEGLCGYSYSESKGKSLGSLLAGQETDACAVTALIHQLFVHGEEATTVLTNYTKEGRKFRNRLSVGPLYDEETGELSHFVGVLKEVSVAS